jgi:SAM-dependent methyltransferase
MSGANLDSTRRFSSRVGDYVKYRPSYPPQLVDVCREQMGMTPASVIADIGSGTGLSTELFLKGGNTVYGVEPNDDMRGAAEQLLAARYPNFRSVNGTAEATTLPDRSVDFVLAAQAYHWFDKATAAREFKRILRAGGHVVIVWNDRKTDTSPLLAGYDQLLHTYGTDYKQVSKTTTSVEDLAHTFGVPFRRSRVPEWPQRFDFDGTQGTRDVGFVLATTRQSRARAVHDGAAPALRREPTGRAGHVRVRDRSVLRPASQSALGNLRFAIDMTVYETTNHNTIYHWATSRGLWPACVAGQPDRIRLGGDEFAARKKRSSRSSGGAGSRSSTAATCSSSTIRRRGGSRWDLAWLHRADESL